MEYLVDISMLSNAVSMIIDNWWQIFLLMIAGTIWGMIIGATPGMSVSIALVLMLVPVIYLPPLLAIIFMSVIYTAAMYGGGVTAIIMNIPGTTGSIATTYDGYPMAKQGRQYEALGYGLVASVLGAFLGWIMMFFVMKPLSLFVLKFGSSELVMLVIFALVFISTFTKTEFIKGILCSLLGLLIGTVGRDLYGVPRGTFGLLELYEGLPLIVTLLGIFAFPEMLRLISQTSISEGALIDNKAKYSFFELFKYVFSLFIKITKYSKTIVRSTFIGLFIGMLPAAGATLASLFCYKQAEMSSKNKDNFGKGEAEGVIASEVGNNACQPGSMTTMLAFGIPGSGASAVLMAVFIMGGLRVGPFLLRESMDLVYALIISSAIMLLILLPLACVFINYAGQLVYIRTKVLVPVVLTLCVFGSLTYKGYFIDAVVLLIFGLLGYLLSELNYPSITLILGIFLGGLLDKQLGIAYTLFAHRLHTLLNRPIFMTLFILTILSVLFNYRHKIMIYFFRGKNKDYS